MEATESHTTPNQPAHPIRLFLLAIGFIAVTVGLYIAWSSPATGYEVSIYSGTPLGYWLSIAVAFLAAGIVTVVNSRDRSAGLGIVLGGMAAVSVGGLPVIRGYRSHGLADSLTHLGWAEEFRTGLMGFFDLLYPAGHSIVALFAEFAGIPTERALIVFMLLMIGLFCIFIPLSAFAITNDLRVTVIAAFSGFMFIPFTTIGTKLYFHTYSIGTMFLPLFVFVLVMYLTTFNGGRSLRKPFTSWEVTLLLAGVGILFLHPQVSLNVVLVLGAIVLLQILYRFRPEHPLGSLQPLYLAFGVLAALWVIWMYNFTGYFGVAERVLDAVMATLQGTAAPGETVGRQGASAQQIGSGLGELFLKLFLIPFIYCFLTLYAIVRVVFMKSRSESHHTTPMVSCFAWSGIVLIPFFALHYAGDMSHLFFRHVGFVLVLATILGAIGIELLIDDIVGQYSGKLLRGVAVVILAGALVLMLLVAFPSPYIYNQNHHATDQDLSGHAAAFENSDESIMFSGIRNWPHRYADALTTDFDNPTMSGGLTGDELTNPSEVASEPFYLPISPVDIDREVIAYQELRYVAEDFEQLEENQYVSKILTNGEFTLYYVESSIDD